MRTRSKKSKRKRESIKKKSKGDSEPHEMEPDWTSECENCGATPVVPCTGLCGPCTFGEADTADGDW